MNEYVKQYPDLMRGKKIMYVHGFGSSAMSGTVTRLRELLPNATVVADDIPIDPHEGIAMLRAMADREQPDLIIGTSMGGMYAEQLYGFDRILINPAFQIADTMGEHGMMGKQTFLNPRKDGIQEFIMTKALCKEYRAVQEECFTPPGLPKGEETTWQTPIEEDRRVWGLFGDEDPLVHTQSLFEKHYSRSISFHGEHRMNDRVFMESVVPVVRWIDDLQEGRERPIIYIGIETLRDSRGQQRSSALKAVRYLIETYNVYFVALSPNYDLDYFKGVQEWTQRIVNVPAYRQLVFTHQPSLLLGDYLIMPCNEEKQHEAFMGTQIPFGNDTFKTWEEIITFFRRLNGE